MATKFTRTLGTLAAAGLTIATPLALGVGTADAYDWSGVAECESSGDWSTNTGNGFGGGLQFTQDTWEANGGTGSPENASQAEQEQVAESVLETQGVGAWPECGQYLEGGAGGGSDSSGYDASYDSSGYDNSSDGSYDDSSDETAQQTTQQETVYDGQDGSLDTGSLGGQVAAADTGYGDAQGGTGDGTHVVEPGDTIAAIAQDYGVAMDQLAQQVQDIDTIFPGDVLSI